VENKITLTDTIFPKIIHIAAICPSLLFIAYSKTAIATILVEVPHNGFWDFAVKYMETDSHAVALSVLALMLCLAILTISSMLLIKGFTSEERSSKILSGILLLVNISLIIYSIIISSILSYVIFSIVIFGIVYISSLEGLEVSDEK
jgi:uncharacterized membrane protein